MPRHQTTPLNADTRLNRPHPDALPSHRQCPDCPDGHVLPLTADYFYEDASRYRWNLSRFSLRCKPHHNARTAENAKTHRERRSGRERVRRAIDKQNRVQAAVFYTPAQAALRTEREAQARERKERNALYKRRAVRAQGGYDPARDGIKLMIRSRMQDAMRRRLAAANALGPAEVPGVVGGSESAGDPGDSTPRMNSLEGQRAAMAWLEMERARNRASATEGQHGPTKNHEDPQ
jgi:hypothetical protein